MSIPPAGVTPLSTFAPAPPTRLGPPPGILADRIRPSDGEVSTLLEGDDPVDAAVAFQFRVRRGSGAAVMQDGHLFTDVRELDDSAADALRHEARRVMEPLAARDDVDVEAVEASVDGDLPGGAAVLVRYVNLPAVRRRGDDSDGARTVRR